MLGGVFSPSLVTKDKNDEEFMYNKFLSLVKIKDPFIAFWPANSSGFLSEYCLPALFYNTDRVKYNASHIGYFKFSKSHIKKVKNKEGKTNLII